MKIFYARNRPMSPITVDDEDWNRVKQYNWSVTIAGNIVAKIKDKTVVLSRFILDCDHLDLQVDHIDGNRFNNQKSNLRLCTSRQNMMNQGLRSDNTSVYKGVSFHKPANKYTAKINLFGKKMHLGYFNSAEAAAKEYDRIAKIHYGEFAFLNFPNSE